MNKIDIGEVTTTRRLRHESTVEIMRVECAVSSDVSLSVPQGFILLEFIFQGR